MEQPNNNTGKNSVTALFAFKAQNTDEVSWKFSLINLPIEICLVIIFEK